MRVVGSAHLIGEVSDSVSAWAIASSSLSCSINSTALGIGSARNSSSRCGSEQTHRASAMDELERIKLTVLDVVEVAEVTAAARIDTRCEWIASNDRAAHPAD
jgi:hypothetical protein